MRVIVMLVGVWAVASASAAEDLDAKRRRMFIVEKDKAEVVEVTGTASLAAERVHLLFSKELQTWSFTKTDDKGKVTEPLEVIAIGSVVPGTWVGAKGASPRYKLTTKGTWVKASEPEKIHLVVTGKTPVIRIVESKPADAYQPVRLAVAADAAAPEKKK